MKNQHGYAPPVVYVAIGAAIIIGLLGWYAYTKSLQLDVCEAEYDAFVSKTEAEGERAKQDAIIKDNQNERNKRMAEAAYKRDKLAMLDRIKQLRDKADSRIRSLPKAAPSSTKPGLYCADRKQFERGYRESLRRLRDRIRAIADGCTARSLKHKSLCNWANSIK